MNRDDCILYSGGATGAEAAFGEEAERHGIDEVNFTFEGHSPARQNSLRVLCNAELRRAGMSVAYVSKLMHRNYPDTPLFQKILQTIWHQVQNGQEIFVVGKVNADGTVQGGTGVAAEFAKLMNKPVFVFDQERNAWSRWLGNAWEPAKDPVIHQSSFCGTGTRFLEKNGQAAIEALFRRSFA